MKQMIKYTLAIAAMLLVSLGAVAEKTATVAYQKDGTACAQDEVGTVTYSNGTITVTPKDGFYLTAADLTVIKTIDGSNANTRTGINTPVTVTATDPDADPSGVTT